MFRSSPLCRPRWLAVGALLLMIASAYNFRSGTGLACWLMLAGGGLLAPALWMVRPACPQPLIPARTPAYGAPVRWPLLLAGLVCLAILAQINAHSVSHTPYHVQMALFAAGIVLTAGGFGARLHPGRWRAAWRNPDQRREIVLVGLITALALGVRLWRLGTIIHITVDSLHFIDGILHLWDDPNARILMPIDDIATFTHVYPYLQSGAVALFGPDLYALRFVSALMGTLTVTALYGLARALFDRPTAIIAALLLATFPPHIHFSRIGLNNIADPTFGLIGLALLAHGLRTNHTSDYAWAGAAFGLTHYFYEGGRLLFMGLSFSWVALALIVWRPSLHLGGILRMGLTAFLVALPVYYALARNGYSIIARFENQSVDEYLSGALDESAQDHFSETRQVYWDKHLRPALEHYVHSPDGSRFYYLGETPLLLWYVTPLFLLGLFWAAWRGGVAGWLPLLWIALNTLGNSLLVTPDWTARFVAVFPALPLLAALGLRAIGALILPENAPVSASNDPQTIRRAGLKQVFPVVVTIVLVGLQTHYYFGPHVDAFNRDFSRHVRDFYDALYRAEDYPPGSYVFYIGDDYIHWPVIDSIRRFWSLDVEVVHVPPKDLDAALIDDLPHDRALLFFLDPYEQDSLDFLREHYTLEGPIWSPYDSVPRANQYVLYVAQHPPAPG